MRPRIIIPASLVIVVLIIVSIIVSRTIAFNTPSSQSSTTVNSNTSPATDEFNLKNYDSDTDSDRLPDFMESKLGLDPNKNEVEGCYVNKCNDPAFQQEYVKKHNVVIILDSSGSMSLKTGEQTKMDAAKQAITDFLKTIDNQTQIGLIQYGHLGSNTAQDKAHSCTGAEILSPLGTLTADNVTSVLTPIKPTGWTPIGLALQKAQEMFVGKEKDINEVFVVTDGAETCDTNPVAAASALAGSSAHVKVNVIGFAVTEKERSSLEAINIAGQGSFTEANNAAELKDVFTRNQQNWSALQNANGCIDTVINQLALCIVRLHRKIDDFRQGYINNPSIIRSQLEANEKVYYSYINYLQNFESQKTSELNKTKNGFVNKL